MQFDMLATNIFFTVLHGFNIVFFSKILFNTQHKKNTVLIFSFVYGALNGLATYLVNAYNIDYFIIKTCIAFLIAVLLLMYILHFDLKKSIIIFGLHSIILILSESLMFLVFSVLNLIYLNEIINTFKDNFMSFFIGNLIIYIISLLILLSVKLFKSYLKLPRDTKTIVVTVIITLFTIAANLWFFFL